MLRFYLITYNAVSISTELEKPLRLVLGLTWSKRDSDGRGLQVSRPLNTRPPINQPMHIKVILGTLNSTNVSSVYN